VVYSFFLVLTGLTGGFWGKRDIFRKGSDSFGHSPFS
jgi:hypothetical protein